MTPCRHFQQGLRTPLFRGNLTLELSTGDDLANALLRFSAMRRRRSRWQGPLARAALGPHLTLASAGVRS